MSERLVRLKDATGSKITPPSAYEGYSFRNARASVYAGPHLLEQPVSDRITCSPEGQDRRPLSKAIPSETLAPPALTRLHGRLAHAPIAYPPAAPKGGLPRVPAR